MVNDNIDENVLKNGVFGIKQNIVQYLEEFASHCADEMWKLGSEVINLRTENDALRKKLDGATILPCKMGDMLYRIVDGKIIEYQVSMITLLSDGKCKVRLSYKLPPYKSKSTHEIYAEKLCENYFNTYEDAEAHLAEPKKKNIDW